MIVGGVGWKAIFKSTRYTWKFVQGGLDFLDLRNARGNRLRKEVIPVFSFEGVFPLLYFEFEDVRL